MKLPAWMVLSLPEVTMTLEGWQDVLQVLGHLDTEEEVDRRTGLRSGRTVWGADVAKRQIALAWEWGEVRSNVPAIQDPMTIHTNIQLLRKDGAVLGESVRLLYLNRTIHDLPWITRIIDWSGARKAA